MRLTIRVVAAIVVSLMLVGMPGVVRADPAIGEPPPQRCANPKPPPPSPPGEWPRAELCEIEDDGDPQPAGDSVRPASPVVPQSTTDLTTLVNTIALTLYLMNPAAPAPPSIVVGPLPPTLP